MPKKEIDDIIRGPPMEVKRQEGIVKIYDSQVLFCAAKAGNTRFIIKLIRSYQDLIWKLIAIKRRHANIYNLLYEIGSMKDMITPIKDKNGNNMLHLVSKTAKPKRLENVSGIALQMQRELLWFNVSLSFQDYEWSFFLYMPVLSTWMPTCYYI
uniref:Uncharacterized protein n=1 Tax=Lactuca sativa TaxID=4236 RepID=A0A9R1XB04_LACSA|nr:hypothetical protein LSAT_V11C600341260 [Lactuca sativa]